MAEPFHPKFASPTVLSKIAPELLIRLLKPFSDWLRSVGIDLRTPRDLDSDGLDRLSLALMAGTNLPPGLPELLNLIDEMSAPELFDRLERRAVAEKLVLPAKVTGADLAVRLYLKAPKKLEELRVEVASLQPRRVARYLAMKEKIPKSPRDLKKRSVALEASLKKDFANRKRGNGTRVHPFTDPHGFRLMIRRGDTLRSQAVIDDADETRRLILRPELYDVVRYDARYGDLLVNARAQADARAYCRFIGRHLFDNDFLFDGIEPPVRYSLEPIRSDGSAILSCAGYPIEEIRLDTLELEHPNYDHGSIRIGPSDVFALLPLVGGRIDAAAIMSKAKLVFKMEGERRARPVTIIPPITVVFEHDELGDIIEQFLLDRHLMLPRTESLRASPESLFAMS